MDLKVQFSLRDVLKSAHEAVEAGDSPIGRLAATRDAERLSDDLLRKIRGNVHPMVRTHPVTGEKALYVRSLVRHRHRGHAAGGVGADTEISDRSPDAAAFTCRLRWEPNTLALWDNRLCVHQAYNDYQGYRRELYRTTVSGETPV